MSMKLSRRQFFPMLIQELIVNLGATQGKLAYQLGELGNQPDEKLAIIRPMVNPAYQIRVIDGQICSQLKGDASATVQAHFPKTPENLAVFNRFNGKQTLREIADAVAKEYEWELDDAFRFVRDIFLILAVHLVVVPQNPLDSELE